MGEVRNCSDSQWKRFEIRINLKFKRKERRSCSDGMRESNEKNKGSNISRKLLKQ